MPLRSPATRSTHGVVGYTSQQCRSSSVLVAMVLFSHQHVQELWQNWTLGEGLLETRWNSTSNNSNPQKGKGHKKGNGKGKHVDVVDTSQPSKTASTAASTVSHPSRTNTEYNWTVHFKRGEVDHGCDNQFRVNKKTSWCIVFTS